MTVESVDRRRILLKYIYTVVYRVKGITYKESDPLFLVTDLVDGVKALLVKDPTSYIVDLDRRSGIITMILDGLTGQSSEGSFSERLSAAVAEVQQSRAAKYQEGPFVIVTITGEVAEFDLSGAREIEDFIFHISDAPKTNVIETAEPVVSSVLAAVLLEADTAIGFDEVTKGVAFFRADEKPIYAFTMTTSADLEVSRSLAKGAEGQIGKRFAQLSGQRALERSVRLLVASLEVEPDRLRAFLAAWSALEMFIRKVYPIYREQFLADSSASSLSEIRERLREGSNHLADQFAAIAFGLCPLDWSGDCEEFMKLKKQRDHLLHGRDVEEKALLVQSVRILTRRYLRLHLDESP